MNEVNETIRAIDAQIGYHQRKIKELHAAKKEIPDKYNIPYGGNHEVQSD